MQESITYRGTNSYSSILAIGLLAYPTGCANVTQGKSSGREDSTPARRHVMGNFVNRVDNISTLEYFREQSHG